MSVVLLMLLVLGCLFLVVWLWFEKGKTDEKSIAVIATLGAIAAVARIPFGGIPNVQPTTFLVMLSGYVFGVRVGFVVGAVAAVLSNLYFGQGPWTVWQMLSWGLAGASGGWLGHLVERDRERPLLETAGKKAAFVTVCTLWGYLFGWVMNLWHFLAYGTVVNWAVFVSVYVSSFGFDTAHAVGNFLFASLFARSFAHIFARYYRKLVITQISVEERRL